MSRLRRACLTVPATSWSKLEKAASIDVDEVVIDLEDAVAAAEKNDATRAQAAAAVARLEWRAPTVAVRVNGLSTPWFRDDVAAVLAGAGPKLACLVLPKVESADEVVETAALVVRMAPESPIGIEAMIETALGVVRVDEIAAASPRLEALVFGSGDYAASLGLPMGEIGAIDPSYPGDQWAYPRSRIAVAARAFGLDPIDGPYARFRDLQGLAESAKRARLLGYTGKWAIHPMQVPVCLEAFGTSAAEEAAAELVLEKLAEAERSGSGAVASDGAMVDEASRRLAERIRRRADRTET